MPSATDILAGLTHIANRWMTVAIYWHVAVAIPLLGVTGDWRPRPRSVAWCIAAPLASVAAFAIASVNPFNAVVFALLAALFVVVGEHDGKPLPKPPGWARVAGALLIAFGWCYPHFLRGEWLQYFYAAPIGLVPCATLAIVIGFALLVGERRRTVVVPLAATGAFYAVFGTIYLGVGIDLVLLAGAAALAASSVGHRAAAPVKQPAIS